MSDNPFASPSEPSQDQSTLEATIVHDRPTTPGLLSFFTIACLLLGISGLFGSCFGFGGLALNAVIQQNLGSQMGGMDEQSAKMQDAMNDIQQEQLIPNAVTMGLNLILAPFLIAGAVGLLTKKPWARGLLRKAAIAAIIFVLVRGIWMLVIQISQKDRMVATFTDNPQLEGMAQFMEIGFYVGYAMSVLMMLALGGFYVWTYLYLGGQKAIQHCATFEQAK